VASGVSLLSAPGEFVGAIVDRINRFTSFVSGYGLVVVVLLFFLLEWPRTLSIIKGRIPEASRREYTILLQRIVSLAQNYLLGSLLIVLFYWLVTAIILAISGVPHPIVLGLLISIPQFIPQGGGLVSAILIFIVTLATGSTTFAVNRLIFAFIEMVIFMVISGTAYYFVDVRIYSKSVNVPVWLILVGIVVFAAAFGVVGAFIAAAAVAIIGELFDFVLKKLRGEDPYPDQPEPPAPQVAVLSPEGDNNPQYEQQQPYQPGSAQ
jgi:predicted PurR-regulated permease PerM